MIPKTKKPEPKDHRPFALTNVGYEIFMSLVMDNVVENIRPVEEESEFQSGNFTGGRRLEDNLFILRYCIKGSYKRGIPLFVMAIDFAKAFDLVNRVVLMWLRCDPYLIQVVTELYMGDCTETLKREMRVGKMEVSNGHYGRNTHFRQICSAVPNFNFIYIYKIT